MTAARSRLLSAAHAFYKDLLSPILHSAGVASSCRFQPTCSEYAALALAQHGPIRGVWLSAARLLRCHPFSRGGWDPVPPAAAPSGRAAHPGKASRPVVHFQSEGLPAPSEQPRQVP